MSQFHCDVKVLLLSLHNLQTLNEAISQVGKCDNWLFQHRQDQCSWNSPNIVIHSLLLQQLFQVYILEQKICRLMQYV
jgi:hypothetical protein